MYHSIVISIEMATKKTYQVRIMAVLMVIFSPNIILAGFFPENSHSGRTRGSGWGHGQC